MQRLAVLSSHPIQYHAVLFRELARRLDAHVFFAHRATPDEQARAGFGAAFEWDVDLTTGYNRSFLNNISPRPGTDRFSGCDTPEIGARLREGRFDAALIFGWHLKSFMQGLIAAKRLGMPVLVRGDSQLATPRSKLKMEAKAIAYPFFLRMFDVALYVGARSRQYYEHYAYPAERLFFSPHCVDIGWFAARATEGARRDLRNMLGVSDEARVLLFAGKLQPFKRPLDIISAARILRARGQNVEAMVAGDGELHSAMIEAAAKDDVPLHMLGFCNQSRMPAVFAASDCLTLPSTGRETWGLVANEALACGRPIVVSDACGCSLDLAADGGAGRSFRTGDVMMLADMIDDIFETAPDAAAMTRVSEQYSPQAAVDGVIAALDYLKRRRSRAVS
ncbi:glycosyltransferase family 4 protein [Methylocystis sp. 9N]|uniref:Glycosyltransferase family 4 protein n=1 Tax=Methylocystis borbori TaxID=3118750 RepID=A0ABU7XC36_9HYPH